jgi:hypothetical protein
VYIWNYINPRLTSGGDRFTIPLLARYPAGKCRVLKTARGSDVGAAGE